MPKIFRRDYDVKSKYLKACFVDRLSNVYSVHSNSIKRHSLTDTGDKYVDVFSFMVVLSRDHLTLKYALNVFRSFLSSCAFGYSVTSCLSRGTWHRHTFSMYHKTDTFLKTYFKKVSRVIKIDCR